MPPPGCANCQTAIDDRFCPHCGQRTRSYREPFWSLAWEIVREAFEVDGRIPRTLVPFFFQPGRLVQEYIAGRRVHFSSPLRVYLFALVVGFFALSFVADELARDVGKDSEVAPPDVALNIDEPVDDTTTDTNKDTNAPIVQVSLGGEPIPVERAANQSWTHALHKALREGQENDGDQIPAPILDKLAEFERMGDRMAVQQILRAFFDLAPKVVSLLVPIFAALLLLLYLRSPFYFIEHVIFSLNFHALALVLFSIAALVGGAAVGVVWLVLAVHLLVALHRVYGQSWGLTVFKFVVLSTIYGCAVLGAFVGAAVGALWFA